MRITELSLLTYFDGYMISDFRKVFDGVRMEKAFSPSKPGLGRNWQHYFGSHAGEFIGGNMTPVKLDQYMIMKNRVRLTRDPFHPIHYVMKDTL